jgi:branched-chain amino acid transport system ATP-binding protein
METCLEALVVENLSKHFGGLSALEGVSFRVDPGERLAIIGPNGAGKTTLFQILSGMITPSSGRISAFGKDITKWPAHRRAALGIGRTFQITNLFLKLTVLDNILLAMEASGLARFNLLRPVSSYKHLHSQAENILKEWGMWDRRDVPVRSLSYGEQRQLEIILTLSQNRSLLLLDEPTCGLSPEEAKGFVSIIRSFPRDVTVLLIDHDMDVTFEIAEKVLVLHFGRVLAFGSPEEVKGNPQVQEIYMGKSDESS